MLLKRKRPEDKSAADRQLMISYKAFLGSQEGREVLFDLVNRYHILNPLPIGRNEFEQGKFEGQRALVTDLLTRANVDVATFDKLLKGEI